MAKRKKVLRRHMTEGGEARGKSAYARKVQGRRQMYGPGCCGHKFVGEVLARLASE